MLTPSLGRSIPGHKSEFGLGHANRLARARQHLLSAKDLKAKLLLVLPDPLSTEAAEPFNQQGLRGKSLFAIDQIVESLVILA